jgi:uncharacterized membrane protein YkoI
MKRDLRKQMAIGMTALALGALGLATAQKTSGQNPSYQGSVRVQEKGGEEAEAQAYQALAKVTREEAVRQAQAALGTTQAPTSVRLGVENGYLVWEVVLGGTEVKVDAGTGQVLHQEAADAEHGEEDGGQDGETADE